jgi:hypothetical protein
MNQSFCDGFGALLFHPPFFFFFIFLIFYRMEFTVDGIIQMTI